MSENDTDKTLTTTSTTSTATDADTKTGSATTGTSNTTTSTTSTSSEFVDDPEEKKETYTLTEEEKVMSDKQYLDSSVDEILAMIKSNSLMAKHSVEENFNSTTRTPSDEPRIVSNLLDAIALALEKLEAEMKAVKNVGTSIQNTDFNESKIAESLGFELTSKQYAPVSTSGNGTNVPKYDGDKALTEQTQKYKQQKEGQSSGGGSLNPGGESYPSDGGGSYPSGGGGTQPAPSQNTPQSNTPQANTPQSNAVTEPNTPVSNTPEPTQAPQESHTTIINNYYYNNRGGGGGGGRHTETAPVETPVPSPEPVVEEVIEEPVVEPIIEEEEIIEEPIASTIPVSAPEPQQSSNTLRKLGVATLVGAGIGAAAYGAHEVMKHKEEKNDYYSNDEEDYATYGYDNDSGEE